LPHICEVVAFDIARIIVTPNDASRILRKVEGYVPGIFKWLLMKWWNRILRPKKVTTFSFGYGGPHLGEIESIFFDTRARNLTHVQDLIARDIFAGKEGLMVDFLTKRYSKNPAQVLEDFKQIAKVVSEEDFGLVYGHPMMQEKDAKKELDEDLGILEKVCLDPRYTLLGLGINTHMQREDRLESMLECYCDIDVGGNVLKQMREKGYSPQNLPAKLDVSPLEYNMFRFLKQEYERDPGSFVRKRVGFSANRPPLFEVRGVAKLGSLGELSSFDASLGKVAKIEIGEGKNSLRVGYDYGRVSINARAYVPDPSLLFLQDPAFEAYGINFGEPKTSNR
jgi:hypothetical protein